MSIETAIAVPEGMQERVAPSRPFRLGTRRRRPSRARFTGDGGREAAKRPSSLDTGNHLQTTAAKPHETVREWLARRENEESIYNRQLHLHAELYNTYHKLWQDRAAAGDHASAVKWEKRALRLRNCRHEWIGYFADCCKSQTQPLAVPIGCNDRLCPLCAWDRSRIARRRIKAMFDRLTHPALITLTIPNIPMFDRKNRPLRKHHFSLFRHRVKQFIGRHKAWILGGVYSLETTFNRQQKTWHIHVHILADVSSPLPPKTEKTMLAGQRVCMFTAIKLRLEYDWVRLWTDHLGKAARKNASQMRREGDAYDFDEWVTAGREMRVREWTPLGYRRIPDLSEAEFARRTAWNIRNRRVVDVRPVEDRDGAVKEVLKYITKCADFSDTPEAVEMFAEAVRGSRLIQTFGSWYGVKLDEKPNPNEPRDWGDFKCSCGCNMWRRMGIFHRRDVSMDSHGRWWLTRIHNWQSAGTVARPTIRALDEREE